MVRPLKETAESLITRIWAENLSSKFDGEFPYEVKTLECEGGNWSYFVVVQEPEHLPEVFFVTLGPKARDVKVIKSPRTKLTNT
jgi:hypothetical protein